MMSTEGDGFTEHRVELSAGPVRYREAGDAGDGGDTGTILFVHGWGVNGTLWTETAERLAAAGHRCIVPDLPFGAHREPMRPDADLSPTGAAAIVAELIRSLGIEGATVVANDSGGAVSQILVTEHPGLAGRLVLTNCDALEKFPPGVFKLLVKGLRVPGFMHVLANSLRLRANQVSPLAFGSLSRERIPNELLDSWVRPPIESLEIRRDSRKFGSGCDPKYTLAAAERLPEVEIPVLLAWGEDDRLFTIDLAERLDALLPNSRIVRIPNSRTFVSIDEPQRLAEEVGAFVSKPGAVAEPA